MRWVEYIKHRLAASRYGGAMTEWRARWKVVRGMHEPAMYEEHASIGRLIERVVNSDTNCLDVGCHFGGTIGEFVRLAPGGTHAMVEPLAYKAAWLRKRFKGVALHECCVGEEDGEVTFYLDVKRSGYSGMSKPSADGSGLREYTVPCRRLDDLVNEATRIGFIKMDVEGAELFALRGAGRILKNDRPVVLFECTPAPCERMGYGVGELFDLFESLGYDVYFPRDYVRDGIPLDRQRFVDATRYPVNARNCVAAPKP